MHDAGVALAALWASIHNLRILVNRGIVLPKEVEDFAGAVFEGLQQGNAADAAIWEAELEPLFAEMKAVAGELCQL